ncbi:MAG: NAD(P)H-dependent glycerol-3-phosphate dehydrogenase [Chloroflexota bacterium]
METVAILGAGAMGSALVTPLVGKGHEVRLWGTELDTAVLEAIGRAQPHPRLGIVSGQGARLFPCERLAEALRGATLVVVAVTSPAALPIYNRALPHLDAGTPVAIVSKGFARDAAGHVRLLPDVLEEAAPGTHPFVAIAGPCKANEVAAAWPTVAVFGAADETVRQRCGDVFSTPRYTVVVTDDLAGVELAAATKNAYAMGLGMCDGLALREGHPWHNLKAALFGQALGEMGLLAEAMGGRVETVAGFAGAGDLEVTALSGRNRALGELIGRGTPGRHAVAEMEGSGQTVEGPAAARLAWELVGELRRRGGTHGASFPLLSALVDLLEGRGEPAPMLMSVLASLRSGGASAPACPPRPPGQGRRDEEMRSS